MPAPRSAAAHSPAGGMMGGLGQFSDERLDEAAMQRAMTQKAVTQQQSSTQPATGKAGTQPLPAGPDTTAPSQTKGTFQPDVPREVGTLKQELVERPAHDIITGLKSFFDINVLLGIQPQADSPEEQAHKKQLHQRWQQLNQEQQQVAKQRYQQELQKKERAKQEEEARKQQEQQAEQQRIAVPKSPKKGPIGPASGGSRKQNAEEMMEQSRKGIGQNTNKH